MTALPARQRDILYAARVDGLTLKELAQRWGISTRLVSRELQTAHEFCAKHMEARTQDCSDDGNKLSDSRKNGSQVPGLKRLKKEKAQA
jgi:RNA polymerase sigma-70 factor (ECF subfamily)